MLHVHVLSSTSQSLNQSPTPRWVNFCFQLNQKVKFLQFSTIWFMQYNALQCCMSCSTQWNTACNSIEYAISIVTQTKIITLWQLWLLLLLLVPSTDISWSFSCLAWHFLVPLAEKLSPEEVTRLSSCRRTPLCVPTFSGLDLPSLDSTFLCKRLQSRILRNSFRNVGFIPAYMNGLIVLDK